MQRKVRTSQGRVPVENLVQDRGQRCKPPVTESATESEPPRATGVRVKRGCKRPPGIPVMGYAMKTSPKQGRIGMLFPLGKRAARSIPQERLSGVATTSERRSQESFRVGRIDKWLQFYHQLVTHRIRLTASISAFFYRPPNPRPHAVNTASQLFITCLTLETSV